MHKLLVAAVTASTLVSVTHLHAQGTAGEIRLLVDVDERINAVYHVACLASEISCSRARFERFWHERLEWTDADQAALDDWQRVVDEAAGRETDEGTPERLTLYPNSPALIPEIVRRERIIAAPFESRALTQGARGLLSVDDVALMTSVHDHFERRLAPWWQAEGRRSAEERARRVEKHLNREVFQDLATQIVGFLEAAPPTWDLYFHAVASPEPDSEQGQATVLANHFMMEMIDGVTAAEMVSIAFHELTHYLYQSMGAEAHLNLIEQFVASRQLAAPGLHAHFNEALATAAQVLFLERLGDDAGEDVYNHPYILPLGLATVPLLRDGLARGATLQSGFVMRYETAGLAALGPKAQEPQFRLSPIAVVTPEADGERLCAAYMAAMRPIGFLCSNDITEVEQFSDQNVVHLTLNEELETHGYNIPGLSILQQGRGFGYALPRSPVARVYVLAGREAQAVLDLVTMMSGLPTLPAEGMFMQID